MIRRKKSFYGVQDIFNLDPLNWVSCIGIKVKKGLMKVKLFWHRFMKGDAGSYRRDYLAGRGVTKNPDRRSFERQGYVEQPRVISDKQVEAAEQGRSLGEGGLPGQINEAGIFDRAHDLLDQWSFSLGSEKNDFTKVLLQDDFDETDVTFQRPSEMMPPVRSRMKCDQLFPNKAMCFKQQIGRSLILLRDSEGNRIGLGNNSYGPKEVEILVDDGAIVLKWNPDRVQKSSSIPFKADPMGSTHGEGQDGVLWHPFAPCSIEDQVEGIRSKLLDKTPFFQRPTVQLDGVIQKGLHDGLRFGKKLKDRVGKWGKGEKRCLWEMVMEGENQWEDADDIPNSTPLKHQNLMAAFQKAGTLKERAKSYARRRDGSEDCLSNPCHDSILKNQTRNVKKSLVNWFSERE